MLKTQSGFVQTQAAARLLSAGLLRSATVRVRLILAFSGKTMGEIAAASQEQSSGIKQVNTAVTQMDQVVQQNASLVEQATAATESMKDQAGALLQLVSRFKLEAQGAPA